ncbi:MAG TPA: SRPBCC family protein [Usitatibacter sp.]|nr:SRPBCC family protein [Usitatibacter sp.]
MATRNGVFLLGLGAGLMYLMDPQNGRKRRADLKNQMDSAVRKAREAQDLVVRDATNRAYGVVHESRRWVENRRQMRTLAAPGDGQAGAAFAKVRADLGGPWSPTSRAAAGAFGGAMLAYGYFCGGLRGFIYGLIGGGLLARATTNRELASLAKGDSLPIEKTIRIAAPVEQVFAYWRNLENFPQWMSHVREVRYIGGDRFHWTVDGPAGVPVEWDSELLNVVDNREMTWRSVEGAAVTHTGRVRFEPDGDGTRVHVQLRYAPMGGVIGHAVAKAFGVDPLSEMNDDLLRIKSLIETGRPPRDSAAMRALGGNGAAPAV